MSEMNIYKMYKQMDECDKRCMKKLLEKDNNKEEGDKKIKELMEWLKKDRYSADSLDPIVNKLDKQLENVKVDFLFLEEIRIENFHKKYPVVLIQVKEEGQHIEIYEIKTLLEKELEERRFLKDNKVIDEMIASTKEAYEEYYGCE